jgi:anaerobic sulfite reductase subunit B
MMNALEKIFRPLGIPDRRIFVNTERKMQCGVGKCQHCASGEKYVCLDGPVFNFDEIDKNWEIGQAGLKKLANKQQSE